MVERVRITLTGPQAVMAARALSALAESLSKPSEARIARNAARVISKAWDAAAALQPAHAAAEHSTGEARP